MDLHLPVTVRGDRMGILTVRMPEDACTQQTVGELTDLAELLGHEIVVAERDTDLYLQARRASRLTLAAEMQWQLLPARACARPEYAIGAQLEPAYDIHGDNFDWSTTAETLTLTVTNGMGEGIEASLLTNLAINALRNARRAGVDIADQAALADQAVYGQYRGHQYVSTLLLSFELATGRGRVVDAGSPRLWRYRDRSVERVEFDAQLPRNDRGIRLHRTGLPGTAGRPPDLRQRRRVRGHPRRRRNLQRTRPGPGDPRHQPPPRRGRAPRDPPGTGRIPRHRPGRRCPGPVHGLVRPALPGLTTPLQRRRAG